jgi:drug/metabolite transporter (DMT)-like permease
MTNTSKALTALAVTTLIWGVTPVILRNLSLALGPYDFLVVRLLISGVILTAVLASTGSFRLPREDWPRLLLISYVGMLGYYALSTFGFAFVTAGVGTLIMATQPIIIALLAWLAGTDRLTPRAILGLFVAFAGSFLLVSADNATGGAVTQRDLLIGSVLIFLAGVAWAIHVVFGRSLIQKHGALKITCLVNMLIAPVALPFLTRDMIDAVTNMPPHAMWSLILLQTLGTASVFTWNYAAGHVRPTLLGASLYIMPILAIFAGWIFLNEAITPVVIAATLVILAGVAISQWKSAT